MQVTKILNLFPPSKSYWNLRVVRFKDHNAADEDACYYQLVEAYYENDVPNGWCEYFPPMVDNLDLPENYTEQDVINKLAKAYIDHMAKVQQALSKPILPAEIFETPSEK